MLETRMPRRQATPARNAPKPLALPAWYRPLLLAIAAVLLLACFSPEIADTDFWWHLKTGQYILQTHRLPDPDPFAYTTAVAGAAYPGELATRHFNLTHEWLGQLLLYFVYSAGGLPGIVVARACMLTAFCALAGWIAYRRSRGFYRSLAAALASSIVIRPFAVDRPTLASFLLLALAIAILDSGKTSLLWLLPILMLVWANSHGGFVLGWVVLVCWSAQALWLQWRHQPVPGAGRLWLSCAVAVLAAGLNPNGFAVVPVLWNYRHSY